MMEMKIKKMFSMFLVFAVGFLLVGVAVAADNAAKAAKPEPMKAEGKIVALNVAKGTFTVKGKIINSKKLITFGQVALKAGVDVDGKIVQLGKFKVGDEVEVSYSDGKASAIGYLPHPELIPMGNVPIQPGPAPAIK